MIAAAIVAAIAACLVVAGPTARDDEGRALLDRIAETYRGLDAYADDGERRLTIRMGEQAIERAEPYRMIYARPDRLSVQTPSTRLVRDGEHLMSAVTPAGFYDQRTDEGPVEVATLAVTAAGSTILGDPLGPPLPLILGLLTGEEPARSIGPEPGAVTLEEDGEFDGETVRVLRVASVGRPDWRLFVDPDRLLIVGAEVVVSAEALDAIAPPGTSLDEVSVVWSARSIHTDAPPADAFAMEPPPGLAEVGPLLDPEARDRAKAEADAADPRVGEPAPVFTVRLLGDDGPGAEVSRDELKGKVVLIDFWATWCGPCLKELPEVAEVIGRYADRGDEVRFLCVSIDEATEDLPALAKELLTFLDDRSLAIRRPPVAEVGLDPEGRMASGFKVKGIPSAFLLDREGVVRAVFVGYDEDIAATLKGRIDGLLGE